MWLKKEFLSKRNVIEKEGFLKRRRGSLNLKSFFQKETWLKKKSFFQQETWLKKKTFLKEEGV